MDLNISNELTVATKQVLDDFSDIGEVIGICAIIKYQDCINIV